MPCHNAADGEVLPATCSAGNVAIYVPSTVHTQSSIIESEQDAHMLDAADHPKLLSA